MNQPIRVLYLKTMGCIPIVQLRHDQDGFQAGHNLGEVNVRLRLAATGAGAGWDEYLAGREGGARRTPLRG